MKRKYRPETIVRKFFFGELKNEHGEQITIEYLCDIDTYDMMHELLYCLSAYGIKK